MRRESAQHRREAAQRKKVRLISIDRDGVCQAFALGLIPEVACGGRLEVNEIVRRGQWRKGYLVESNTVALCSNHHQWVTEHPLLAADTPFYRRGSGRPISKENEDDRPV